MLFPTIAFAVFFLLVAAVWPVVPDRRSARAAFLAGASCLFYAAASVPMLGYLLGWCAFLWWAGRDARRSPGLVLTGAAILQLTFWKLFELVPRAELPGPMAHWAVPLGVSFFTFQGLTYLFSRMKGELTERWSFVEVVAFVAFFPTVFSGPIQRANAWEAQMAADPRARQSPETFSIALGWLVLGLFYKLVLSTVLGEAVDAAWSEPSEQNPLSLWLAVYGYAFQLYTDFCGYSYLAAAVALLLGFDVPRNFDRPYLAGSVQEFWRRWHMSLSSWLRDYLYIAALQGNARGKARQVLNVLVTFFLCGAWHGLALHYLVWGVWHALGVAYSTVAKLLRTGAAAQVTGWRRLGHLLVTFHFVALGWVWFRAPDTQAAWDFSRTLLAGGATWQPEHGLTLAVVLLAAACHLAENRLASLGRLVLRVPGFVLQTAVWAALVVAVLMASPEGLPPFIYFKY